MQTLRAAAKQEREQLVADVEQVRQLREEAHQAELQTVGSTAVTAAAQDARLAQLKEQFEQLADYLADEHRLPFVIERIKERLEELRRLQRENEWLKTAEYLLSPEEWGHDALDIVGFIPVIGEIADGINALWYAAEGDYTNAALSGAAIIPVVGDIGGKGFRQGKKLLKGAKALDKLNDARRLYRRTTSTAEAAENLVRSTRKLDDIPALAKTGGKAPRGTGLVDDAAGAVGREPNRIYSARELIRRVEEPGPFHNFPESFNDDIFKGTRTVVSPDYVTYTKPGTITLPGKPIFDARGVRIGEGPARVVEGVYEIGVRPSASGRTEVIVHRFFRPNAN